MPELLRRGEGKERGGRKGRLLLLRSREGEGEGTEEEGEYVYKCRSCIQILKQI